MRSAEAMERRREQARAYRLAHPERIQASLDKNRVKRLESRRLYKERHKEEIRAANKGYYQEHSKEVAARTKAYKLEHTHPDVLESRRLDKLYVDDLRYINREKARLVLQVAADSHRALFVESYGGACFVCGGTDDLNFHHEDPDGKEFDVSDRWRRSIEHLIPEVSKCELLCRTCHRGVHGRQA
jgi:hypothetical protein